MWREAGHNPDEVVAIAGAEVIMGDVRQPVEMVGPRWMAHAGQASRMIANTGPIAVADPCSIGTSRQRPPVHSV